MGESFMSLFSMPHMDVWNQDKNAQQWPVPDVVEGRTLKSEGRNDQLWWGTRLRQQHISHF